MNVTPHLPSSIVPGLGLSGSLKSVRFVTDQNTTTVISEELMPVAEKTLRIGVNRRRRKEKFFSIGMMSCQGFRSIASEPGLDPRPGRRWLLA